jgi:hypothetical protein
MNIVTLTPENLEQEHICCAISNNKDCQVSAKKSWLANRFADGLVFKKGDVRGKCFIEYVPAEKAWCPIEAENYMFINCLWVSGQFKGHGNSNLLLDECIRDSKEKNKRGLCIVSSDKKRPFLSDPKYLKHKGFLVADSAGPYFELLYLPFDGAGADDLTERDAAEGAGAGSAAANENANTLKPRFKPCAKNAKALRGDEHGFVLYYAHQCPFTAKYVPLIEELA